MINFQPKQYRYQTQAKWKGGDTGTTISQDNPSLDFTLPENLQGPGGNWSPDEMLVSSTEACAMLTFFWLLREKDVEVLSYESTAEGISQIAEDGIFRFVKITIKPIISVNHENDVPKVKEAVLKLDDWCCVSNSLKTKIIIDAEIKIG
jgi:peroxiredoxin-like protein